MKKEIYMEAALKIIHSWADYRLEYDRHGDLIKLLQDIRAVAAKGLGLDVTILYKK